MRPYSGSAGLFAGTSMGEYEGSAFAIMAADGTLYFYMVDDTPSPATGEVSGGFGAISTPDRFWADLLPFIVQVTKEFSPYTLRGVYDWQIRGVVSLFRVP
jgi:hypothetical protein